MHNCEIIRVLLINPPPSKIGKDRSIPIGLFYIASSLKKAGFIVEVADLNNVYYDKEVKLEQLLQIFEHKAPDIVGIACPFSIRFGAALRLCQLIKKEYPHLPVVMGGIHPTMFAQEIMHHSDADYIVLGEGEESFVHLIKAHFGSRDFGKVDGLVFRQKNQVILNEKKRFIQSLDELPFPAYDLIDLKDYFFDTSEWQNPKGLPINVPMPLITSRSCPNRCSFCSMFLVHGKKFRARSPQNVVDEIEDLYKTYGQRYFSIMDDNFTLVKERAISIAEEIVRRRLDIQFDAPNGLAINSLDKDVLDALIKAGLIRFSVGIESGSDFIRNKVIGKHLHRDRILEFNELLKGYKDLFVKAFFVIGFPEETRETLQDTYRLLKVLNVQQLGLFYAVPYPGTRLFHQCVSEGRLTVPLDSLWKYDSYDNSATRPFIKPDALTIEELIAFREKTFALFEGGCWDDLLFRYRRGAL